MVNSFSWRLILDFPCWSSATAQTNRPTRDLAHGWFGSPETLELCRDSDGISWCKTWSLDCSISSWSRYIQQGFLHGKYAWRWMLAYVATEMARATDIPWFCNVPSVERHWGTQMIFQNSSLSKSCFCRKLGRSQAMWDAMSRKNCIIVCRGWTKVLGIIPIAKFSRLNRALFVKNCHALQLSGQQRAMRHLETSFVPPCQAAKWGPLGFNNSFSFSFFSSPPSLCCYALWPELHISCSGCSGPRLDPHAKENSR